jgi:hypothetical protein
MRFLVIVKAFDTVTAEQDIKRLRQIAGEKAQEIAKSGKLIEGGNFVDARAGFWLLDVDSATELWELLFPVHELCHIETHPIQSWEELGEGFKKLASS